MIHLHSMLSSETNTAAGQNGGAAQSHSTLSQDRLDSFHGALSDAVSSTLEKFGIHPSDVKISITRTSAIVTPPSASAASALPDASSTSGASASTPASTTANSSGAPDGGYDPFLQAASNNPFQSTPTPSTSPATATSTPLDAQQAFDNAYWASQPAPVQALRTMQNQEQRTALATQLANEGYSIDVPIMVWGWDPSITTAMRQSEGYTWVPSALQNPVAEAPGVPSMGTLAAYNPNNPPAGSIAV